MQKSRDIPNNIYPNIPNSSKISPYVWAVEQSIDKSDFIKTTLDLCPKKKKKKINYRHDFLHVKKKVKGEKEIIFFNGNKKKRFYLPIEVTKFINAVFLEKICIVFIFKDKCFKFEKKYTRCFKV